MVILGSTVRKEYYFKDRRQESRDLQLLFPASDIIFNIGSVNWKPFQFHQKTNTPSNICLIGMSIHCYAVNVTSVHSNRMRIIHIINTE